MLSGLNNLETYTLLDEEYSAYFGFSEALFMVTALYKLVLNQLLMPFYVYMKHTASYS